MSEIMKNNELYDKLTPQRKQLIDKVLANLEKGNGLWEQGWKTSGIPQSGILDFTENHVVGIDALEHLISSEKIMKDFLLNNRNNIEAIEHHIFFFDEIREITGNTEMAELRPHVTFHRGITSYTFCFEDDGTYGTITNMMGIVLITLYRKGSKEKWERTQIQNGIGSIEAKDQRITSVVGNEFMNILKTAQSASNSISEKQMDKIVENLKNKADKIKDYPVFADWLSDRELHKK